MTKFKIKNGSVVELAIDFAIVNVEDAADAQSICIVEVRNAPAGTPHYAYFLKGKNVADLDRNDLDAIDEAIGAKFPKFREILESAAKPGNIRSGTEWAKAVEPGYFDLSAYPQYWVTRL